MELLLCSVQAVEGGTAEAGSRSVRACILRISTNGACETDSLFCKLAGPSQRSELALLAQRWCARFESGQPDRMPSYCYSSLEIEETHKSDIISVVDLATLTASALS